MIRTASHEIRTPMNTVALGLRLLEKELKENNFFNQDISEILSDVTDSCDVTLDLVSDLLTHEKIEGGTMNLDKTELRIWELIKHVAKPFVNQVRNMNK